MLYFCDRRWYEWHKPAVDMFEGLRVTLENLTLQADLAVESLRDYGPTGMPPSNDGVTNGRNSGFQALQLAIWLGAKRILLLGFDMKEKDGRAHWHAEHPIPTPGNIYGSMIECFNGIAPELKKRGIEVINASPDSALKCFPKMTVAEALCFPA